MAGTTPRKRAAKPKPSAIRSIIDEFETPETTVTLCTKGSLVAEFERLEAELGNLTADPVNLAGDGPGRDVARRLDELREQMLKYMRPFHLRAVTPHSAWRQLFGRLPVKTADLDGDDWAEQYHAWLAEVVAASAVDPVMTADDVLELADKLSDGQWQKLAGSAWSLNNDSQTIPFSAAASVLSRSSGGKSKQPETSDSPAHGSLAGSPPSEPSSSATETDASPAG